MGDEDEAMSDESDRLWCRGLWSTLAEGGVWAVPRSGLVFSKRGERLVLVERMPYLDEMREAFEAGKDVPGSAEELAAYQESDYVTIRDKFESAGITVEKEVA